MSETYTSLVGISQKFLGPAGERFIDRQVSSHLNKKPEEVTTADIPKISEWVRVSASLLTNDKKVVEEFITEINKLSA